MMSQPYNDPEKMLKMSQHPEGLAPEEMLVVGKSVPHIDSIKLAMGKPAYTADFILPGMLYAKILHSPHAHAIIKQIDASKARALPGVRAVLTYEDIHPVRFTTAGQSYPLPSPLDTLVLDRKMRFAGDRVAAVAADTPEVAEAALSLIDVEYEVLPAVIEIKDALKPEAPIIHDEPDCSGFEGVYFPQKNIAAFIKAEAGDLDKGYAEAHRIIENEYRVPQVQQVSLEPAAACTLTTCGLRVSDQITAGIELVHLHVRQRTGRHEIDMGHQTRGPPLFRRAVFRAKSHTGRRWRFVLEKNHPDMNRRRHTAL